MATIALLTDFGVDDPYVGQLKGVLASLAPQANIVDISHSITPYDVHQGGFFLQASWQWFPEETVFVSVVDPGVGSSRRIIGFEMDNRFFLLPDNGLGALLLSARVATVKQLSFYDLSDFSLQDYPHAPVHLRHASTSSSFHGRDIFVPVAALLASDYSLDSIGKKIPAEELVTYKSIEKVLPAQSSSGTEVQVLHIDRFGNCVLSLPVDYPLPESRSIELKGKGLQYKLSAASCYQKIPKNTVALIRGSQGYWELAANMQSASYILGIQQGKVVSLSTQP
ncbi:MAG: SAM hydrolase/SAM-dependent halogenase family protein [Desulfovibrio sp.]